MAVNETTSGTIEDRNMDWVNNGDLLVAGGAKLIVMQVQQSMFQQTRISKYSSICAGDSSLGASSSSGSPIRFIWVQQRLPLLKTGR